MNIKKGALVKAWDGSPSNYVLGVLVESYSDGACDIKRIGGYIFEMFSNFAIVPPELAKQIEDLK